MDHMYWKENRVRVTFCGTGFLRGHILEASTEEQFRDR